MASDNAVELVILNTKTIDSVGLKAHLDLSKIKYNKEKKTLEGFDDQIKNIIETKAYLFERNRSK